MNPVKKLADAPEEVRRRFEELRQQPRINLIDAMKPESAAEVKRGHAAEVNRWIISTLKFLARNHMPPSEEMIELVAQQLKVGERARKQPRLLQERALALRFLAREPGLGSKKLAARCRVAVKTVKRWRNEPHFREALKILAAHPDASIAQIPDSMQILVLGREEGKR